MVINLRRHRRMRANKRGLLAPIGSYRRDRIGARRYRCFLNGVEVTNQTFYADSRRGIVRMFKHNAEGQPYLVWNEAAKSREAAWEERRGHVQLIRRKVAA